MHPNRRFPAATAAFVVAASLGLAACDKPIVTSQAPTQAQPAPATGSPDNRASTAVGQAVDDTVITGKVKASLLSDPDVKGTAINVDTRNGVVTLNGEVETQGQVDKAVALAQATEGVSAINNSLTVKR